MAAELQVNERDRVRLLQNLPMFAGLHPSELSVLALKLDNRHLGTGDVVFEIGDNGPSMFFIVTGCVHIVLPGKGTEYIYLNDLGPGEYFGEMSLFDEKPRSASAICATDVEILELGRQALVNFITIHPQASLSIFQTLSERLRQTNLLLSTLVSKNAFEEEEEKFGWGDRLSGRVAKFNGSWAFIIGLFSLTLAWAVYNTIWFKNSFDPYPYPFYNLFLAILVALQGPLIMMSQNREASLDRATAANDYEINLKNEMNIETIVRELCEFRTSSAKSLQQLETRLGKVEDVICKDETLQ